MAQQAITFDFHNTLVHCDEWFEIEVRTLPSAFLRWRAESIGAAHSNGAGAVLDRAYRRLRAAIIAHGHELTAERSLAVVLADAGIAADDDTIARAVYDLMRSTLRTAEAVPGAVETVSALARRGCALGVVSSAVYHPFLDWALEGLGIRQHFGVVVTSAACGFYKSRPEIYWEALTALNATPANSVHVGDSAKFDVDGANRAGMRTVWLDAGTANRPSSQPDLTVTSLAGSSPLILDLLTVGAS